MEDKKSYTIPANVRYHRKLTAGAKLLYGEIEFICKVNGYCQQRNDSFAKLYGVNIWTISKWIGLLQKNRLIKCKIRKKFIRVIFLQNVSEKSIRGILQNLKGVSEKPQDDTTYHKQEQLDNAALADKDDFNIKTKRWIDKDGKKHGIDSIDYGEKSQ